MNDRIYQHIWILLKCVGASVVILLIINLATFLIALIFYGLLNEVWEFHLKHGVFSLNGRIIGLKLYEPAANGLMMVLFIAAIAQEYKQPPCN